MDYSRYPITANDANRRIDRIVRRFLPEQQLSAVYSLIRKGLVRLDGKKTAPSTLAPEGSLLWIADILLTDKKPSQIEYSGKNGAMPPVILETPDLLFLLKPQGIPVHGEGGLDRIVPSSQGAESSLSFRTGPLHRLDRDTSGIIAFSRSLEGARWFSSEIASHTIEKYYIGLAKGLLEKPEEWTDLDENGKKMITFADPLAIKECTDPEENFSLVRYRIITGRKHQIRIQTALHGYPLAGDIRYETKGKNRGETNIIREAATSTESRFTYATYFLHAWLLSLPENRPAGLPSHLSAPLPSLFSKVILEFFSTDVLANINKLEVYWNQA